ncbi:sodium bicarbonate cotransporter 3, partial [Camelus ferus]
MNAVLIQVGLFNISQPFIRTFVWLFKTLDTLLQDASRSQGPDEEAVVDLGKTSSTVNTKFEKEELENTPSQRVQFILGTEDDDEEHIPHDLFTEMDELCYRDGEEYEWKETARWLKFEEDVEDGGDRWSKPYVATLSLHSLFELRSCILNGTVMLDMRASTLDEIADMVLDNMIASGQLDESIRENVREALLKRHHHQNEKRFTSRIPLVRSFADIGKKHSEPHLLERNGEGLSASRHSLRTGLSASSLSLRGDSPLSLLLSHLLPPSRAGTPAGSRCASPVPTPQSSPPSSPSAGRLDSRSCRHSQLQVLVSPAAAGVPTVVIHPPEEDLEALRGQEQKDEENADSAPGNLDNSKSGEMKGNGSGGSRENSTVDFSKIFHDVAYKAKDRNDLLSGIDEFLDQVTVLPPGEWDPSIRIEPPKSVPSQCGTQGSHRSEEPRSRTGQGRSFRETDAVENFSLKQPDAPKCVSPLTPPVGILSSPNTLMVTLTWHNTQMNRECSGLKRFRLRGGDFLFEAELENKVTACGDAGGEGTAGGADASSLVCYITRFTEEAFAALICIIFIYEALEKLFHLGEIYAFNMNNNLDELTSYSCVCVEPSNPGNETLKVWEERNITVRDIPWGNLTVSECKTFHGTFVGSACSLHGPYIPDVLFWCVILFFTTFFLSSFLKQFKTKRYFPTKVRSTISDFAVFLTIVIMVAIDYLVGVPSPKLHVPEKFEPTDPNRGWIISPLGENPWWTLLIAAIPALLCTILIFMDQQITAVIINRKEHKLKKGAGYHLDLLMVGVMLGVCSVMGLPWFVAATVLSISHVNSLKVESECSAPGEQPKFLGIREQRVTGLMIFILMGLSVFMTSVLKFFDRIKLFGMPAKHQPDLIYLRYVPLWKVHVFTVMQLTCLVLLWVIKASAAAVVFPMMVAGTRRGPRGEEHGPPLGQCDSSRDNEKDDFGLGLKEGPSSGSVCTLLNYAAFTLVQAVLERQGSGQRSGWPRCALGRSRETSRSPGSFCLLPPPHSWEQARVVVLFLPAINFESAQSSMTKSEPAIGAAGHRARGQWHESTEAVELENFSFKCMEMVAHGYLSHGEAQHSVDKLVNMT